MSKNDAIAKLEADRAALRAFWAGNQDQPLVLEHPPGELYCACDVFEPSRWGRIAAVLRYLVVQLAGLMPLQCLKTFLYRWLGMKIGKGIWISPGVVMDPLFPSLIELEDGCLLGIGCRLFTHEFTATNFRIGRIRIGKGSVVGAYATVRSGVTIGSKVTVGFNSYVNRDVPDGMTVGGVPARILKGPVAGESPAASGENV